LRLRIVRKANKTGISNIFGFANIFLDNLFLTPSMNSGAPTITMPDPRKDITASGLALKTRENVFINRIVKMRGL
jgi:hypothetical protein